VQGEMKKRKKKASSPKAQGPSPIALTPELPKLLSGINELFSSQTQFNFMLCDYLFNLYFEYLIV
jgi:hypothetical protein